jgi:hypothetical protein
MFVAFADDARGSLRVFGVIQRGKGIDRGLPSEMAIDAGV